MMADDLARDAITASIRLVDGLRLVARFDGLASDPACRAYVAPATARPSFVRSHAEPPARFADAD